MTEHYSNRQHPPHRGEVVLTHERVRKLCLATPSHLSVLVIFGDRRG